MCLLARDERLQACRPAGRKHGWDLKFHVAISWQLGGDCNGPGSAEFRLLGPCICVFYKKKIYIKLILWAFKFAGKFTFLSLSVPICKMCPLAWIQFSTETIHGALTLCQAWCWGQDTLP